MINNKVSVNNTQPISVNNTKAFSLIELSIVLIIVALIIGGIISGKSLVTNSKIVTVASDVKSLNIALQSFQDSFNMLPGDITTTIGGIVEDNTKGNGDWYIGNGHPLNKESVNAFAHLSKANFINEKFEGNNTPNKISDLTKDHYIESKSFKNTFLYLGATNFGSKANTINRIMFVSTKTGNSFTPAVAKAYNCKFDNCDPFTGKVISLNIKYDLESTASNKYNQYNFNLINSAKAEEANSNACVDANGYTTTTKEVCTVNISDLNINDNKESYVTDFEKEGNVSMGTDISKDSIPNSSSDPADPQAPADVCTSTPPTVDNLLSWTTTGSTRLGTCQEGYLGNPKVVCRANGSWSTVNGSCKPKNCSVVDSFSDTILETAIIEITNGSQGYKACGDDFAGGYTILSCDKGSISENKQNCIAKSCTIAEDLIDKVFSDDTLLTKLTEIPNNSTAYSICDEGYTGYKSATCTNGVLTAWSDGITGSCTPKSCTIAEDLIDKVFSDTILTTKITETTVVGNSVIYSSCDPMYEGYKTGTCQAGTLNWTNGNELTCSKIPDKCWSASGGKTNADNTASTEASATLANSYLGFMDTDCCNPTKGLYVDLDLKLQKALGNPADYDTAWKSKPKQEKLIKFVSLSGTYVDLKCLNLSGLNLSGSILEFNTAISSKKVYFSYRPAPASAKSTLNDGANLENANFSGASFSYVSFGYNYYSSGNPGSNLTNANFSGSSFSGSVYFGFNNYSSGNPGSNLTNANFSGSSFSYVDFGFNTNSSSGNPGSNLTNANFSGSSFSNYAYFGHNPSSSGNPGSNVKGAKFGGICSESGSTKCKSITSNFISAGKYRVYVLNTNMALAEFYSESNGTKIDKPSDVPALSTYKLLETVGINVYNPYCNANMANCCLKPTTSNQSNATPSTCSAGQEKWDGTKDETK